MPTYNFTSDLRISVLPERIQTAATEIIHNELSTDKSASNNRATLAFYFNLVDGTNTLKLAANGSITEVVRNFVLKFQFPNTYTADIFNKNIEEHTLIAPLRETVKLLAYQYLVDREQNPYLTYDEIKFFVFGNPELFRGTTSDDYERIIEKVKNNRSNGHDYTSEINNLLNWKQYDRQSRELISIIPYACDSFKTSSGKLILSMPNPLSDKFADVLHFVASIMKEDKMWIPTDKVYDQAAKESYIQYMDINGEVELCKQANPSTVSECKSPLDEPLQQIFFGAPGTGKSHTIAKETNPRNSTRTTFHPDSDYASFVGAYKPTMEDVDFSYITDGKVKFAQRAKSDDGREHPGTQQKIVYKYVPQAFLKSYVAAWKAYIANTPYYLIIEEINRGNCAQIFGDLFQLLDRSDEGYSSYPIAADDDIRKFLVSDEKGFKGLEATDPEAYAAISGFEVRDGNGELIINGAEILSGEKLLLPQNLYIWATMNTSDQSLFPIDSAFKRRWEWKYVPISDAGKRWVICINGVRYNWWSFVDTINQKIWDATHSEDKKLGYFFCKANKEDGVITADKFVGKVLFYIYNDVFKDYGFDDAIFKDEQGKDDSYLLFKDFFMPDGKPREDKIQVFLKNLGVKTEEEVKAEMASIEPSTEDTANVERDPANDPDAFELNSVQADNQNDNL